MLATRTTFEATNANHSTFITARRALPKGQMSAIAAHEGERTKYSPPNQYHDDDNYCEHVMCSKQANDSET